MSERVNVPFCVPELVGAKATSIVQLAPPVKELPPQLSVSVNCPEIATPLIVTVALPVLVTVTVFEPLVCPTLTRPKLRLVGDTLTVVDPEDETPEPVREIVWGLVEALSVMVTAPVRVPVVVGVKLTLIVQLAPAATEDPQVPEPEKAKSPPIVRPLIVSVAFPVLVSVTACAALAVPTV